MMNKNEFTKMAKRILRSSEGLHSPQLMHPSRDWIIGLLVAIVFFAAAAVWSSMTYLEYQEIAISNEDVTEVDIVVYRESLVEASLKEFDERARTYEFLLAGAVSQTTFDRELEAQAELERQATSTEEVVSTSTEERVTDTTEEGGVNDVLESSTSTNQAANDEESAAGVE